LSGARPHRHAAALDVSSAADVRFLRIAMVLLIGFLTGEVVAAVLGNSLALLADAGHMFTDVAALAMSAWVIRLVARPASGSLTFGLKRAEILSAAVNGVTLAAFAILIGAESVQRLIRPTHVHGYLMTAMALVGIVVNVVVAGVLAKANRSSLNIRGAYVHILTDLYAFIGTAVAGVVIILSKWNRADAIASLLVAGLMGVTAKGLLVDAGRILLQAAPDDLNLDDVRHHLIEVAHVTDVHDLHAWTVTSGSPTLSAHVVVEDRCFETGHTPQILDSIQACLNEHFAIAHATIQLEPASHLDHEDELHS